MRKKRRKYFILCGIAVVVLGAAALVLFSPLFVIKSIRIVGSNHLNEREILMSLPFEIGDNIFSFSANKARKAILKDKRISAVEISRKLPNRIELTIEEESPALLLAHETIWGLTENGRVLPIENPYQMPNLPILSGIGAETIITPYSVPVSARFDLGMACWREIKNTSPEFLDKVSEMCVCDDSNFKIILVGDGLVVDFGNENIAKKLKRLESILDELGPERKYAKRIDLRLSNQAIVAMDKMKRQKKSG